MDSLESNCYHSSGTGAVQTVSVGTQSCMDGDGINCIGSHIDDHNDLIQTKSKAQVSSGNYINIVPMGVQYTQRRKFSSPIQSDYQSSPRIFFSGNSDYASRDRCTDDYYTLQPSSMQITDQIHEIGNATMLQNASNSVISSPITIAVQQHQSQIQSPLPQQQSVAPSVLYTVQRVITTSQIQSTEMIECSNNAAPNVHIATATNSTCSNTYQAQAQMMPPMNDSEQSASGNFYATASAPNGVQQETVSVNRTLQNVIPMCVYLMSRVAVHMEIEGTARCPAQVILAATVGCDELGITNKLLAQNIFALWMTSPLLELQLKCQHRPFGIRVSWAKLINRYSTANALQKRYDEPMIQLRRSVFIAKREEEKIRDPRIIELLYEEAKYNVLNGRYVLEPVHAIMLGGIQARIELGQYSPHAHTIGYFRENQARFLPQHVAKSSSWSWMPYSRKTSAEFKLLEQYQRVPTAATTRKLMRKYLEFCWALPFYGAAFFHGQIEQPVRGLMSFFSHRDAPILVGINERGVFIVDKVNGTLLLGLKYDEISWDLAKPSATDDPECLPCIFIQFDAVENGIRASKLLQVFSKQAPMMDALIAHFVEQMKRRRNGENGQAPENVAEEPNPIQHNGCGVLSNKLSKLTLATFDEDGRCIGQLGSLSISY